MENKINIAELLCNCSRGMELDCTIYDNACFEQINEKDNNYPIIINIGNSKTICLTKEGHWNKFPNAKCVIFPKGKTTWEGFHRPFKDGDIIHICDKHDNTTYVAILKQIEKEREIKIHCFYNFEDDYIGTHDFLGNGYNTRFATEEEKEELFKAINDSGYCWNDENKTLEKLVKPTPKPCFKCGDKIRHKKDKAIIKTIGYIYKDSYALYDGRLLFFSEQDQYELIPNKFDILMLKPFDKVLVRDYNDECWMTGIYSHRRNNIFIASGHWEQCIPYEGNEHLLGTTDSCDDYFKTWKDE